MNHPSLPLTDKEAKQLHKLLTKFSRAPEVPRALRSSQIPLPGETMNPYLSHEAKEIVALVSKWLSNYAQDELDMEKL